MVAGSLACAAIAQDKPAPHVPLQKTIGETTATGPVPSLAVMNSDGASLADGKLVLTGVSPNTIVFADRPIRAAGHLVTADFLEQWDETKGGFAGDPPNATVSVLGGAGDEVTDAVVTLTNPSLDGSTLTFDAKVLEGSLSGAGPAAVFIDGFRGGGGGFHAGAASFEGPRGGSATFAHAGGYGRGYEGDISDHYYHAPVYHGAWYGADHYSHPYAAGALTGAAIGAAAATAANPYNYRYGYGYGVPPYCGYPPYPPCQ
jgi:hypothetical protein